MMIYVSTIGVEFNINQLFNRQTLTALLKGYNDYFLTYSWTQCSTQMSYATYPKNIYCDQIKEDDMDGIYNAHGGD
jgi:hypothetical protein